MYKIQAYATKDHRVFVTIHDNHVSTSFYLKPEEANEIGNIGRMVAAQRDAAQGKKVVPLKQEMKDRMD
jgi:hypothetical protein